MHLLYNNFLYMDILARYSMAFWSSGSGQRLHASAAPKRHPVALTGLLARACVTQGIPRHIFVGRLCHHAQPGLHAYAVVLLYGYCLYSLFSKLVA